MRFAAFRQFLAVFRNALLDRGAHFLVDREEPVGWTEAVHGLVRTPVVVVLHPPGDAFPCLFERLEPRLGQELVLERLPEPFDLPQRHRMMRRAADVFDMVLGQFLLELGLPAPDGVLPAVVGQHLLRPPELPHRRAVEVQHVHAHRAAIDPQGHDVARKIIDERDDVRHLALKREVRDVALPQLVRRGTLEPPWRLLPLVPRLWPQFHQTGADEFLTHGLRTGLEPEKPPQYLRDAPHAPLRILRLQGHDLLPHRRRHLRGAARTPHRLQPGAAVLLVLPDPVVDRALVQSQFAGHQWRCKTFLAV